MVFVEIAIIVLCLFSTAGVERRLERAIYAICFV
jgi:hypothetical protein